VYRPLDDEKGTGILDVQRVLVQHTGGEQEEKVQNPAGIGPIGWNREPLSASFGVDEYEFNFAIRKGSFITATLTWDRRITESDADNSVENTDTYAEDTSGAGVVPDFQLYIYYQGALVAESVSVGENVEHLHYPVPQDGNAFDYAIRVDLVGSDTTFHDYALAWWAPSITVPVGHLKCYKTKDTRAKVDYTLDLISGVGGFPNEPGCTLKSKSKRVCVEVEKQNVVPTPPGGGPNVPLLSSVSGAFLSYKIKCPKGAVAPVDLADQFGGGLFTVKTAKELLVPASPGAANDHFKCYRVKDARPRATYAVDLQPNAPGFLQETGCTVKLPAKRICVQVTKQNVSPAPPGGGPGPGPGSGQGFIQYKLKCPKQELPSASLTDQFGTGTFPPKKADALLVPAL
jgi:hypothetical protein